MFINRRRINGPSDVFDKRRQQMTPLLLLHRCEKHIAEIITWSCSWRYRSTSIYFAWSIPNATFVLISLHGTKLKRFNFLIIKLCPVHYTRLCKTKVNYWYAQMLQISPRASHSVPKCFKSFRNNVKVFVRKF